MGGGGGERSRKKEWAGDREEKRGGIPVHGKHETCTYRGGVSLEEEGSRLERQPLLSRLHSLSPVSLNFSWSGPGLPQAWEEGVEPQW